MCDLQTTTIASEYGSYLDNPKDFFGKFSEAWKKVAFQVIKLETRQVYREPGNPSYEALESGDFQKALMLMEQSRERDVGLYASLEERGVDFIRCRPVIYPLSDYLKWEMASYKFNARHGEKIYFTEDLSLFENVALHDFMVFDRDFAVMHDYDLNGEIQGGWLIQSGPAIDSLIHIFALIKSQSKRFECTRAFNDPV